MSECAVIRAGALTLAVVMAGPAGAQETVHSERSESRLEASAVPPTELTPLERARARRWELSEKEWSRYRTLMQGIRGSISPVTISPIEVLGIHARDVTERRRYAEAWARAMREDVDRVLAFQRAYDEAGRRLFPDERLIDSARLPRREDRSGALEPGDRVLLFTRADCTACDAVLGRLLARSDQIDGVDIYLSGVTPGDDAAVRDWAVARQISPDWVRSRRVTLNYDAGALERMTDRPVDRPYLMRRRGEEISVLDASAL